MVPKNEIVLFTVLAILAFILPACQKYSEVETPAGTVPPVQSITPPPSSPDNQTSIKTTIPSRREIQHSRADSSKVISDFRKAYKEQDSPRIAIFLNRSLSDEVRQWQSDERVVISGEGEKLSAGTANKTPASDTTVNVQTGAINVQSGQGATGSVELEGSDDKQRSMTIQSQQYIEETKRYGPGEQWMWAFEDGVLSTFLKAKVNIIDRATILRLTAAKSAEGKDIQLITVKQIEMDALKDHADIFIELLVSRFMSSPYGYEFKAAVKDVKTGRILANVTSADWKGQKRRGRAVIATENGYKLGGAMRLPAVKDVASDLAIDVMNALIHIWSE
jgi:hypothetical protein